MNTERTLIIIPTYNERENAPGIVKSVLEVVPDADLLMVDDNSPDGTADMMEELYRPDPRFSVMRRAGLRGLGRSYVDGYLYAVSSGYARVAQMDADFSHKPAYLPGMIDLSAGSDVVLGSRYCPGGGVDNWPPHRYWLSRFANAYVAAITGLTVGDSTSGFRVYTRRALERIPLVKIQSNGYAFQVEMTYRAREQGLTMVESPIIFTDRLEGQSKISRTVLIESMIMPWKLRFGIRARTELKTASTVVKK